MRKGGKAPAMKKGGKVKKYANGKSVDAPVDVKDPQALTDRIAREENEADRDLVMKPIRAVGKVISKGIDAAKSAIKGQGAVTETERSNINKKKGGKIKKFADGGFTAEEEKYLGGADRTDPFILARMRSALGERKPQGSYIPNADATMDNRDVGMAKPYQAPNVEQDSGLAYPQENELRTGQMRRAPAGPSADDRLRMRNARPYVAPNVEQDSGVAYPQGRDNVSTLRNSLFPGGGFNLPSAYKAPTSPVNARPAQTIPSANFKMPGNFQLPNAAPMAATAPAIPSAGVGAPMSFAERLRLAKLKTSGQQ
jgi:hypothetical protein